MSIYSTQWRLKFPRYGRDYTGCDWIDVFAQGVPAHIGSPTPGNGYENGDPYSDFLPPLVEVSPDYDGLLLRAVVFVTDETEKGTFRCGQEFIRPLLVLSGAEYKAMSFSDLHERLCDALRGSRPRLVGEFLRPGEKPRLFFEDGTIEDVEG